MTTTTPDLTTAIREALIKRVAADNNLTIEAATTAVAGVMLFGTRSSYVAIVRPAATALLVETMEPFQRAAQAQWDAFRAWADAMAKAANTTVAAWSAALATPAGGTDAKSGEAS